MLTLQCVIAGVSTNTLTPLKLHSMSKDLHFILLIGSSDNTVLVMQLIQKVAGRLGAPTVAPAALHQQQPWHYEQTPQPTSYAQPQDGYQAQLSDSFALLGQQQKAAWTECAGNQHAYNQYACNQYAQSGQMAGHQYGGSQQAA